MLKRGQASTEFLTTYGWMILILTLIIVILVTIGVFKPPIPSECKVNTPFTCEDFSFREGGFELTLNTGRISGGSVIPSGVLINDQQCTNVMVFGNSPGDLSLNSGITKIRCYGDINQIKEDSKGSAEVKMNYISGDTGLEHTIKALITGKVEDSLYMNNFDNSVTLNYDFDNDNSTGAIDDSYYNNHGVLNYVTSTSSGCAYGKCYYFSPASISTSYSKAFGVDSFSIELWFKPDALLGVEIEPRVLISNGWRVGPNINGFGITWRRYPPFDYLGLDIGSGGFINSDIFELPPGNDLHYVAIVVDRQNGNVIHRYLDGEVQPNSISILFDAVGMMSSVSIGTLDPSAPLSTWYPFVGSIDNVRIYQRALTPEEVKDHYNELE